MSAVKRNRVFVVLALLGVVGSVWLLRVKDSAESTRANESYAASEKSSNQLKVEKQPAPLNDTHLPEEHQSEEVVDKQPDGAISTAPQWLSQQKWELLVKHHERGKLENNNIVFYGKVVDQTGKPVPGAMVRYQISGYNEDFIDTIQASHVKPEDISMTREMNQSTLTNANGFFDIIEGRGKTLFLKSITRNGYVDFVNTSGTYSYGKNFRDAQLHQPQENRPVEFVLWRRSGSDGAVHFENTRVWLSEGRTQYISLSPEPLKGSAANYDIQVEVFRENETRSAAWTMLIASREGGVQTTSDEILFSAPEQGYEEQLEIALGADMRDRNFKIYFLSETSDRTIYGALDCRLIKYPDGRSMFEFDCLINSTGSRNLEVTSDM